VAIRVNEQYTVQSFAENGSTRSMDVAIVDMSSNTWDAKGTEVFNGIVQGFQLLHDELSLVEGFRVTLHDVDYVFSGDNSWDALNDALNSQGFTEPKHYHVVYDGRLLPSKVGSYHRTRTDDGTMWHDGDADGISGLSLSTTRPLTVSSYIRGLHQLTHNYINEDIAIKYADSNDGYDAVHELGTSTADARTVMADRFGPLTRLFVSNPLIKGDCDDPDCRFFCAPDEETLAFSECTINAVEESIRANES
jgi:hypothetical protein